MKAADRNGRPSVRFQICDRDPLDRIAGLFGNRVIGPIPQHKGALGKRPVFEWKISGQKAVALLTRCMPWLSARYADRARTVMLYTTREHSGRKLTPQQAADIKAALAFGRHGIGRQLAAKYGVTDGMISAIKRGRSW